MTLSRNADLIIANGQSLSNAIDLNERGLCGFVMPAAWTAANLTFQGSIDGQNYFNVYDKAGTEYVVVADASRYIIVNPAEFAGLKWIKVRSGTAAAAVNQGAARTIIPVARRLV